MSFDPRLLAAVYSFLLPGLGQVFRRRYALGLAFFGAFSALLASGKRPGLLPLLSLAAALELLWHERKYPPAPIASSNRVPAELRGRAFVYTAVGITSFLTWFFAAGPAILGFRFPR